MTQAHERKDAVGNQLCTNGVRSRACKNRATWQYNTTGGSGQPLAIPYCEQHMAMFTHIRNITPFVAVRS
jgi:hypothetical protein